MKEIRRAPQWFKSHEVDGTWVLFTGQPASPTEYAITAMADIRDEGVGIMSFFYVLKYHPNQEEFDELTSMESAMSALASLKRQYEHAKAENAKAGRMVVYNFANRV